MIFSKHFAGPLHCKQKLPITAQPISGGIFRHLVSQHVAQAPANLAPWT
jgi:hypothetical protein